MSLELPQSHRYAILGTGAVGAFYGARLQRAGLTVHFLAHHDYDHLARQGLKVESPQGNFVLPHVHVYQDIHQMPRCEVVIVSLKTTQNHLLAQFLPTVLQEDGVVLILQNGLGVEEEVARMVGSHRVMGGLCFLCSHKIGPGHVCHLDYGTITLGEYQANHEPAGISKRMHQIAMDFERAGVPIQLVEDLWLARWKKLVWNIPFNGLSVVLHAKTDEMMAHPEIRQLVEQLMGEVAQGAKSYQRIIPASFIEKMLSDTENMIPYKTSMMLDYEAQKSLEVEAIFGNPLRFAQRAGVELPHVAMLYRQLKFLDAKNHA